MDHHLPIHLNGQTGQGMSSDAPATPGAVSIVRLHGEACYTCGAVHAKLGPAGTVTTIVDGGEREWPIVACPEHLPQVQA